MQRVKAPWILVGAIVVLVTLQCGVDKGPGPDGEGLIIAPDSCTVEVSSSQEFSVELAGQAPDVTWYVDGTLGGTPSTGMITRIAGKWVYVAPPEKPSAGHVTLKAVGEADTSLQATAKVVIEKELLTRFVAIAPADSTVPVADSVAFSATFVECSSQHVTWEMDLVTGDPDQWGTLRSNGTYVAPASPSGNFTLMVRASSDGCADKIGIARIIVKAPMAFTIEIEDTLASSGGGLQIVTCGGEGGRLALYGLDQPGEWVLVRMQVPASGTYSASIWYAGPDNSNIGENIIGQGCGFGGLDPEADFTLDKGSGFG
jgi:hypothetical protein